MGFGSLLAPAAAARLLKPITPGKGRFGKALVATAVGAVAATTIADIVARRTAPRDSEVESFARKVAGVGGVVSVVTGGIAITTTLAARTSPNRLWRRRIVRDLGTGPAVVAAAILGWDFIYYWNHRFMHESRYMWAVHVVHHSSERYNLSTALRQPVADALGTFVPYGALSLFGVRPELVAQARGINLLYQYWIHTDTIRRLGPFERVFNTPSHHRVHHGSNRQYIDRNHGSILIVWDRLFGTFEREARPGRLRAHEEPRHVRPDARRGARALRDAARRPAVDHVARAPVVRAARPRVGVPSPRRVRGGERASARVGRPGEARAINRDVDRPARCHQLLAGVGLGADEELPTLASVEAGAHHERLVDGHGRDVANRELARERGFVHHPDHETGHVVERRGDDAAVGATGCTLERAPQHDVGDDLVAFVAHLELDASGVGGATDRPIVEAHSRPGRKPAGADAGLHQREPVATRGRGQRGHVHPGGDGDCMQLLVRRVALGERVDEVAERRGGFGSGGVG